VSEFSDRPLVAGTIRGVRSFRVTPDGVLTGVTQKECAFIPGVNHAECRSLDFLFRVVAVRKHPVASLNCGCGYYAYFDGSNDYRMYLVLEEFLHPGHIAGFTGIIEGTGVVTFGSRGFRASKAELVALVAPSGGRIDRPRWARTKTLSYAAGALMYAAIFADAVTRGDALWIGLGGVCSLLAAAYSGAHGRRWLLWRRQAARAAALVARVKGRYPGVPWYASKAEAIAAHPLSAPPAAEVKSNTEAAS
jgi:hypothetical protein